LNVERLLPLLRSKLLQRPALFCRLEDIRVK